MRMISFHQSKFLCYFFLREFLCYSYIRNCTVFIDEDILHLFDLPYIYLFIIIPSNDLCILLHFQLEDPLIRHISISI